MFTHGHQFAAAVEQPRTSHESFRSSLNPTCLEDHDLQDMGDDEEALRELNHTIEVYQMATAPVVSGKYDNPSSLRRLSSMAKELNSPSVPTLIEETLTNKDTHITTQPDATYEDAKPVNNLRADVLIPMDTERLSTDSPHPMLALQAGTGDDVGVTSQYSIHEYDFVSAEELRIASRMQSSNAILSEPG